MMRVLTALVALGLACSGTEPRMTQPSDAETRIAALPRPITLAALEPILGPPKQDIGSGIHIYVYPLDATTKIRVGTPDNDKVMYVVIETPAGTRDLYRP
jgi:hypothetical protein